MKNLLVKILSALSSETGNLIGMAACIVGVFASINTSVKTGSYFTVLMIGVFVLQFSIFFSYWREKRNRRKK